VCKQEAQKRVGALTKPTITQTALQSSTEEGRGRSLKAEELMAHQLTTTGKILLKGARRR